jgi:hypothetical protein
MLASYPLLDIGVSYVIDSGVELSAEQVVGVRSALDKFIHRMISYHDAARILAPVLRSTQALDKIERILRTPLAPLPDAPLTALRDDGRAKTRQWSQYEDQRLIAGIHRFGTVDWVVIANFVGNSRTKSQCYQRWTRGLDPNINKEKWTPEQDSRLLMLVSLHGCKAWSQISQEFGNRCDVQCRYRYKQLAKEPTFEQAQKEAKSAAREYARTQQEFLECAKHKIGRCRLGVTPRFAPFNRPLPFAPLSYCQVLPRPIMMATCHPMDIVHQNPEFWGHSIESRMGQSSLCQIPVRHPDLRDIQVRASDSVSYIAPRMS